MNKPITAAAIGALAMLILPGGGIAASAGPGPHVALVGRAVLPVETYAPGPVSGQFQTGVFNGITFPLPAQPGQGVSSIIDGRHPRESTGMPDNG